MTTSWPSPQFSARRLPPQDWEPRRRRNSVAGLGVTVIWGQRAVTPRGREAARTAPPSQDSKPGPVGPRGHPGAERAPRQRPLGVQSALVGHSPPTREVRTLWSCEPGGPGPCSDPPTGAS